MAKTFSDFSQLKALKKDLPQEAPKAAPTLAEPKKRQRTTILKTKEEIQAQQEGFKKEGFDIGEAEACVTPVHIKGGVAQATKMAKDLRENYRIFCSVVVYPVIPKGMVIFRIVCTAAHTMEDVEYTLKAFKEIKAKLDAGYYDGDDVAAMTVMSAE